MDTQVKAITPVKFALCAYKPEVWAHVFKPTTVNAHVYPFNSKIYGLSTELLDRAHCETDPTHLQLIPYAVMTTGDGRILSYIRGNATGEERLKAKMSIGIGGHVDTAPPVSSIAYNHYKHLCYECAREIQEETGVDVSASGITFSGFIYEEVTEVGKVHLGLLTFVQISDAEASSIVEEAGHVEKFKWLSVGELLVPENYDRLELWSQAVVTHLSEMTVMNKAL